MSYTVKIEQTYHYPNRMKYIAQTDSFVEKEKKVSFMRETSASLTVGSKNLERLPAIISMLLS